MSERRAVIIDCDPGLDDAIALLLAMASPDEIELLGITTVAGNAELRHCADNARKICELAGHSETAVFGGCARPIIYPLVTAPHVHGASGLAGAELAAPGMQLQNQHAIDFIIDTVKTRDDVTLCPIGPLTNIAVALVKAPEIAARVREIVLMGGAMGQGNVSAAAEFNFYVDPHAARIVFESAIETVMFGLDVTHQVLVTAQRLEAFSKLGSRVGDCVAAMLAALPQDELGRHGGNPLHDPCVIAYLIEPGLFSGRDCCVEIITDAGPGRGQSIVDWWSVAGRDANAKVIDAADNDGIFRLLNERLARF